MENFLAPTVFESSMSEVGKSVAKRTAATDIGGILVSAPRQEPAQNSDIEGGCGGLSLHPGESLISGHRMEMCCKPVLTWMP